MLSVALRNSIYGKPKKTLKKGEKTLDHFVIVRYLPV
jgi:hypothetical protein